MAHHCSYPQPQALYPFRAVRESCSAASKTQTRCWLLGAGGEGMGRQAKAQHLPERHRRPPRLGRLGKRCEPAGLPLAWPVGDGRRCSLLELGSFSALVHLRLFLPTSVHPWTAVRHWNCKHGARANPKRQRHRQSGTTLVPGRTDGRVPFLPSCAGGGADVRRSSDVASLPLWPFRSGPTRPRRARDQR